MKVQHVNLRAELGKRKKKNQPVEVIRKSKNGN